MSLFKSLTKNKTKLVLVLILLLAVGFFGFKKLSQKNQKPQYQTSTAQKGTLVTTISASGQVTSGSSVSVLTQSSGMIASILVKNGDYVSQGQTIATLALDQISAQKQASAYASYLQSKSSLDNANNTLNTLQNTEFTANQKFINDAVERGLATDDPTYIEENATWLAAEAAYKNQQGVIDSAQASLTSSSLNLSQNSSTITAPISGTVTGLTIAVGSPIAQSSNSSNTGTTTGQSVGSISQEGPLQAQVSVSEIDSVNVNIGQKVTMTLDAFTGKTFTGKVVSIDTNGVVSSGVTTYPATISFDTKPDHVYPNMGVNATIITNIKNDVLLIPSGAVQTTGGQSTVRVLSNGQVQTVTVTAGDSSDTQTEITSGLNEGDEVVTGVTQSGTVTPSGQTTSPFGGTTRAGGGGFGGGGGGGARFTRGG